VTQPSGTFAFNPTLGELTLYAFNLCQMRPSALLQEHMQSARMAANLMLGRWSSQGVNLWRVDLVQTPLVKGQTAYPYDPSVIVILDAYISTINTDGSANDRIILPISRSEYSSYPNKEMQGFPTVFWADRLIDPTVTIWPVPDGNQTFLSYYCVRQIDDAAFSNATGVNLPTYFFEAFAYGLAARLAAIWAPQLAPALKAMADEAYSIACDQNVETSNIYVSPMLGQYFR
jgi:hypothetical protein